MSPSEIAASQVTVALHGAAGRMGLAMCQAIGQFPSLRLHAALDHPGHPALGQDLGTLAGVAACAVPLRDDPSCLAGAEVVIDFSRPAGTRSLLPHALAHRCALVVGTTGLEPSDLQALSEAARQIPVLQAANFSLGVNLLLHLVQQAAAALPAPGEGRDAGWDIEVIEAHHRHKVDAPSGTALALGQAAALGRQVELQTEAVFARVGDTGARPSDAIGFATIRAGDVVGEHSVWFATGGERLELSHKATDRLIFARGALHAAAWLARQPAGAYMMADVLGLSGSS